MAIADGSRRIADGSRVARRTPGVHPPPRQGRLALTMGQAGPI
jgi:hypothetical protein